MQKIHTIIKTIKLSKYKQGPFQELLKSETRQVNDPLAYFFILPVFNCPLSQTVRALQLQLIVHQIYRAISSIKTHTLLSQNKIYPLLLVRRTFELVCNSVPVWDPIADHSHRVSAIVRFYEGQPLVCNKMGYICAFTSCTQHYNLNQIYTNFVNKLLAIIPIIIIIIFH